MQILWSPSSGVLIVQTGLWLSQAWSPAYQILSSALWPEREGLDGMGLGPSTVVEAVI